MIDAKERGFPLSKVYDDMMNGEIYWPGDEELMKQQLDCMEKLYDYNATRPHEWEKRQKLLKEMLAEAGEDCYIEPPLHANWGGHHLHLGKQVYANYNLTAVDDGEIFIGDYTMIGPNVTLATPNHPLAPELREKGYQYNLPIRIGKNVWLGAGVIVVPGVTIGDNTVIGAGSVVTRDIPAGVLAFGVPCRVQRELGERDWEFYHKGRRVPQELLKYRRPGKETQA